MCEELFAYAYRLLARRAYTKAEMAKKLESKADQRTVRNVIKRLAEEKYLDDYAFARSYVHYRCSVRPLGRTLLEIKLCSRGVPKAIIQKVLDEIKPEEEEAMAKSLVKKKAAMLNNLEPQLRRQRLYRFLISRGFSSAIAQKYAEF